MAKAGGHSPRLWRLVAKEAWRRLRRSLRTGPAYRWRYAGRTPDRVLIAPPDLRLADAYLASEMYHGRFPLAGRMVETGGESPFGVEGASEAWLKSLHGFRWLRHMREAGTDLASANARALIADWIETDGSRLRGIAWEPDVTSKRIIAWLQHSTIVLQGAEFQFYRAFLRSLSLQIRYLRAMVREMPDGEERLRARIALAFSALSLPTASTTLRNATRNLARELDRQVLADGGHISRNPLAILELLADLLPLRQTYANQAEAPPPALIGAIDRMLPALRFFRHQDGNLARFNGMGATIPDRIVAILRHDDAIGQPLLHAPHSGFERLTMGATTVIADTGAPVSPDVSAQAHAGCLSFEFSSKRRVLVANSGVDTYGPKDFLALARATAAHSTAVLNDTSSSRILSSPRLRAFLGPLLVGGPSRVRSRRTDAAGTQGFVASHDGYVSQVGVVHERELSLGAEGAVLDGVDRFHRPDGSAPRDRDDAVAVRFHVHPDVNLLRDKAQRLVLSAGEDNHWRFECEAVKPAVEESIFFAGLTGPRRNLQIVLHFRASQNREVRWRFLRLRG
ncbi:heparinase II/III family protein [Aquibium oceanicum]|uniref:Heparinase n=1 Tax=Aquibium oceanicum TaxID=1670800 RepID=A0A1L3SXG7_9HYPH|nr:heparinase II/III family protein [Aquibium oceanicum]APH74070.1 heparinase [Aquibium oceanicum]